MRAGLSWLVVLGLAVAGAVTTSGCFHPDKPSCAFSCAVPPQTCPPGFVCGADELCHDPTRTSVCPIQLVDGAAMPEDAGSGDAARADAAGGDAAGADAARDSAPDSAADR